MRIQEGERGDRARGEEPAERMEARARSGPTEARPRSWRRVSIEHPLGSRGIR